MMNGNEAKKPPLGWILVGSAILLACAVLLKGRPPGSQSGQVAASPALGRTAPDFEFAADGGARHKLSELKGKAVLLNFWASWCEPCMAEMDSLIDLEKQLKDKPFLLLALNADDESPDNRAVRKRAMPSHLVYDFSKVALSQYEVSSIPLSVLIDAQGTIRQVFLGPRDWTDREMLSLIESATH